MVYRQCVKCSELKAYILSRIGNNGRKYYKDFTNSLWDGYTCPECKKQRCTEYDRKNGRRKARKDLDSALQVKALNSELIVGKFYEQLGFTVKYTKYHGPDLIVSSPHGAFTVEVKTVEARGNSLRIPKVTKNRLKDDMIIAVHNNKIIYMCSMLKHLNSCGKDGRRLLNGKDVA